MSIGGPIGPRGIPSPLDAGAEAETPEDSGATAAAPSPRGALLARLPFGRGMRVREIGPKRKKLPEPSGVAYHPERGTLFVVGDHGHIAELTREGDIVRKERLGKYDLEGVTVGPGGQIFAVIESPPRILEIDPQDLEVKREFKVKTKLDGDRLLARHKNEGLEGLVWVPTEQAFYAVNQDHPPVLVKLELPLDDPKGGKAKITEALDLRDIIVDAASDVSFDAESGHLLITEAGSKKGRGVLHEMTMEGEVLRSVPLPGAYPEGFALDDQGRAFIAQDGGKLVRADPCW